MPTTAQPAAGTTIPSTPLSASLRIARNEADTTASTLCGGAGSYVANGGGPAWSTDGDGRYLQAPSGFAQYIPASNVGPEYTLISITKRVAGAGASQALIDCDANPPRVWQHSENTAGLVGITPFNTGGSTDGGVTSAQTLSTAALSIVIVRVRFDSAAGKYKSKIGVDGVSPAEVQWTGTPKSLAGGTDMLGIGNRVGGGQSVTTSKRYHWAVLNRAISDWEWDWLMANKWALFDEAPDIATQPTNQSVGAGSTATFTAAFTASAGGLTYQWQRFDSAAGTWGNVSGANSASYTTPATSVSGGSANNNDRYRCVASDSNGSSATNEATLTVSPVSNLTGNVTLDPVLAAGSMGSSSSDLSGSVTLADVTPAGTLGLQPGVITITDLRNENNGPQHGITIPWLTVQRVADGVQVLALANQVSDGSTGNLQISHAALVTGTWYVVTGWDTDRTKAGIWFKQAA